VIDTLGDIIRNNAHKFPDETAVVFEGRRIGFGEYCERSHRVSSALYGLGIRRQDRVAVLSQNSPEFLELYGAAELSGYIIATVNYRLAAPEMAFMLGDSTPRVLVFEAQYSAIVESLRASLPHIEHFICIGGDVPSWALDYGAMVEAASPEGAPIRSAPDDIMHLIYTSGTTGRPKGVMRRHHNDIAVANLMATEIGVLVSDRMQLMMPLFHVGSRFLQLGAHLRGSGIVLHRQFNPVDVVETIEAERVTITHMAPTMVQAMLDALDNGRHDMSSLHTICYSAAPMPVPVLRRGLARLGPVFLQLYGMTEGGGTTLHKRQHNPDGGAEDILRLSSIGQAAPTVDVRIVDDDGADVPVGQPGEIVTRTASVMAGYWNNSAATIAALRDGWYYTGDVGRLDAQGFLYLMDRKKDMIISGGENIYSREVEDALAAHPAVHDVAVIGVVDSHWGETVRAIVVLRAGTQASESELVEHCRSLIASYKKPRSIVFTDELPRLPSGKVNKMILRRTLGGPVG
jgi:acyl-CoA synthetase (AMP-forming)/AMP-acid ligase II